MRLRLETVSDAGDVGFWTDLDALGWAVFSSFRDT